MLEIKSISIGGFANIDKVSINDAQTVALIAPNSYGKSNVLSAVAFGVKFLAATPAEKASMMGNALAMPINKATEGKPFSFEIIGTVQDGDITSEFLYSYSFLWATNGKPGCINNETLRIRMAGDPKFRAAVLRESGEHFKYLPWVTGRCNREVPTEGNTLALNKLSNQDDLFYVWLLRQVLSLDIPYVDTLENPSAYFSADSNGGVPLLGGQTVSAYIYQLMAADRCNYSMLKDAICKLLPNIERFEPIEVILGEGLANRIYDIRIKEWNNSQPTSIRQISSGSKRVIFILTLCMAADIHHIPMMMLEEPENSIHPRLLQNLLSAMRSIAIDTRLLITSHSPHLMRYFNAEQLLLGLPNDKGLAQFAMLKPGKVKTVYRRASEMDITFGEYMYEMLLDMEDDKSLIGDFFQK